MGQIKPVGDTVPVMSASSPIRNPALQRIIISDLVSKLGSRMTYLALPWFVLVTSHSATRMGLVSGAELLPVAVFGIPASAVIERLGIRRTVVLGDCAQALLIGLVPALYLLKTLPFWLILVLVGAVGTVSSPYFTAQRLLLPHVLGDDEVAVTAGNALIEASMWGSQLAGPAMAGLLIAVAGALNVLWIDAGTFVFSAAVLYGLPKRKTDLSGVAGSSGVLAGVRYAVRDRVLMRLVLSATGYGVFLPLILMALPIMADVQFGANPRVAGGLLAAWGGGALTGSFVVMPAVRRIQPLHLGAVAGVGIALPLWFLPIGQPVMTIALIMAVSGLFLPLLNAPGFMLLSTRPPAELRTQVMTFVVTANMLAGPLAYIAGGPLFARFGTGPVLAAVAVGVTLCAGVLFTFLRPGTNQSSDRGDVTANPALPDCHHAGVQEHVGG